MNKIQSAIVAALLANCLGATAGSLGISGRVSVSESGATLYSLPIEVPPGAVR